MFDSKLRFGFGFGLAIAIAATGCPADDGGANDEGTGTSDATDTVGTMGTMATMSMSGASMSTTGEPMACYGIGGPNPVGDACASNDDCMSGVCLAFRDVPADADAVCGEEPADCATHVTATLFDFSEFVATGTAVPLGGTEVSVLKALEAITNPTGATPIVTATSGNDGRIDVVSDGAINAAIAIIAVAGGGDYFLTATGVGSEIPDSGGFYDVGIGIHEFWSVRTSTLEEWSMALMDDKDAAAELGDGLGVSGGVIGLVRDSTGAPVMGATVESESDTSNAVIRYPQEDGTMGTEGTGPSGTFVMVGVPASPEDFTATAGAMSGGGTAGSAANVAFTLILTVS